MGEEIQFDDKLGFWIPCLKFSKPIYRLVLSKLLYALPGNELGFIFNPEFLDSFHNFDIAKNIAAERQFIENFPHAEENVSYQTHHTVLHPDGNLYRENE